MQVHNLMEDVVTKTVEGLFKDTSRVEPSLSECLQCRMDVICYVLNRIKPEYIISGRGLVHFEDDYHDKLQIQADIIALATEGIKKITEIKRPYYLGDKNPATKKYPFLYNFPAILGRVLNGKSFEPVDNTLVSLYFEGEPMRMIDSTWVNPYLIVKSTRGSFSFLPLPSPAAETGQKKNFPLELRISKDGYEPLSHFFNLELTSEKEQRVSYNMEWTYKTETLYLFPEGEKER